MYQQAPGAAPPGGAPPPEAPPEEKKKDVIDAEFEETPS
jgi:hypothetical protein